MKKIINKVLIITLVVCMFSVNTVSVFASSSYQLNIVKDSAETKYLENDQGYISKKIISSDSKNGEVTVELTVSNTSENDASIKYDNTEVWIIIPEEVEFSTTIATKIEYIKQMASKILSESDNVKIGIIGVTGPTTNGTNGTATDAEYVSELTDDYATLINNLNNMNSEKVSYNFNHQAALRLANTSFSENVNKVVITLVDGITQTGIGIDNVISGGTSAAKADLNAKAIAIQGEINTLKSIGANLIVLRSEYENYIYTYGSSITIDANEYIDLMYGTVDNPFCGKIYEVTDENLENIITENIYMYIYSMIQNSIKNVTITDYFPDDITDNFEFSYVTKPANGTISSNITDNKIEYSLDELAGNESVTISYKLKLKNMANIKLLDKVINTNEKVVLTYTDSSNKNYEVTLTSSPSIKLEKADEKADEKVDEKGETKEETNVETTVENPSTGLYISLGIVGLAVCSGIFYIVYRKKNYFKRI